MRWSRILHIVRNIQGAINAGLRVGVYFYSQAINEAEAVEEASMVLSLVSGYSLPLGVYYDTESVGGGRANALSAAERTACAVAFCETIRSAGYSAGVYSYASWFYNALNFANISKVQHLDRPVPRYAELQLQAQYMAVHRLRQRQGDLEAGGYEYWVKKAPAFSDAGVLRYGAFSLGRRWPRLRPRPDEGKARHSSQ